VVKKIRKVRSDKGGHHVRRWHALIHLQITQAQPLG
jgi:hypothetical protein